MSTIDGTEVSMSQNDSLRLAQEFLGRMGSGTEPAEIARLFSESVEWEIAGDTGVLPWIGRKSGRAAITDFVNDSRAMIERISFDVLDILAGFSRAFKLARGVSPIQYRRAAQSRSFHGTLSRKARLGPR